MTETQSSDSTVVEPPAPAPAHGPLEEQLRSLRHQIRMTGEHVRGLMGNPEVQLVESQVLRGEICANLMLAFRHLEDARMRLGKAIQARQGGKSIYGD